MTFNLQDAEGKSLGMELQNLSSNWKKLQEQLKYDTKDAPKRSHRIVREKARKVTRIAPAPGAPHDSLGMNKRRKMNVSATASHQRMPSASLAIWAEDNDISAKDLTAAYGASLKDVATPELSRMADDINGGRSTTAQAGRYVAVDCEMVGVGPNPERDSALARVSIVNYHGEQLYDSFVLPKEQVTDYRTAVSGITPRLLKEARDFETVQTEVARLLDGKVLVGHAIRNDLDALLLGHPQRDIRDTSRHPAFRLLTKGSTPGLKRLARDVLGVDIQGGEHSSIEDARATMLLFRRDKEGFEKDHLSKWGPDRRLKEEGQTTDKGESRAGKKTKKKKNKTKK